MPSPRWNLLKTSGCEALVAVSGRLRSRRCRDGSPLHRPDYCGSCSTVKWFKRVNHRRVEQTCNSVLQRGK
ncbi:hypothetical protein MAR_005062 [Mya arenaria]|uniref:Secreted protein n=1 Tax=Mya arenaria TaxID=6604 RepID=A0ABY7F231_MYAAR|nr:hypothetical protein MAR_005021 [Mya arenaria]WAR14957.1 hypothetical protein MAR_005062 [Mya arenaria]